MSNIASLDLGGAGTQSLYETLKYYDSIGLLPKEPDRDLRPMIPYSDGIESADVESAQDSVGWSIGHKSVQGLPNRAYQFAALDSQSSEVGRLMDDFGGRGIDALDHFIFTLGQEGGFGGDTNRARRVLSESRIDAVNVLRGMELFQANCLLLRYGTGGGTGSALAEYILDPWLREAYPDLRPNVGAIVCNPSQMVSPARKDAARSSIDYLIRNVKEGSKNPLSFVIAVDNDMLLLNQAFRLGKLSLGDLSGFRREVDQCFVNQEYKKKLKWTIKNYIKKMDGGMKLQDANPLLFTYGAPFYLMITGDLFKSNPWEFFVPGAYKVDIKDSMVPMNSGIYNPAYAEYYNRKKMLDFYKSNDHWGSIVEQYGLLSLLSDLTLTYHSALPWLMNRPGDVIEKIMVMIWTNGADGNNEELGVAPCQQIREYFQDEVRLPEDNIEVYRLEGGRDPLIGYEKTRKGTPFVKVWTYARLKEDRERDILGWKYQ